MPKLSVYYIVKNEEDRLAKSLAQAVKLSAEIIVVDSGSTDRTIEIAESFGVKVVFHEWQGFAVQKAYAAGLCRNDWVLNLDADEVLSDEVVACIQRAMQRNDLDQYGGFKMRWVHVPPFPEHPMKYSPPQYILRLYHRCRAGFEVKPHSIADRPHAQEGKIGVLKGDVYHKGVLSLIQLEKKYAAMSTDQANDYIQHGRFISVFRVLMEFPLKFLKYYFLKGNFRNGWYGYCVAMIAANRTFMRLAKAREGQMLAKVDAKKDREL